MKEEIRIHGAPVSEGVAVGKPTFLQSAESSPPDFPIDFNQVDAEIARYRQAVFSSKEDLQKLRQDLAMEGSDEAVSFIETHIQMLDDPMITTQMESTIRERLRNTESVFHSVIKDYESRFSKRTDSFFQERLVDVKDVSKRILGHLQSDQDDVEIPTGSIILADEISPSYIAAAHVAQIGAFITKSGGGNAHAALIARSKGIPYVTSIDVAPLEDMDIDEIIVDGFEGLIIANPSEETRALYKEKQKQLATRYQAFLEADHLPAETIDKYAIKLLVNVGNPSDLDAFPYKHDGVGLFRTEYLFLESKEFYPSEDFQEKIYKELLQKAKGRPVVLRVFDLGGDKIPSLFPGHSREPNPVLGFRGIRFLLRNLELFKMQLRAVFKAAPHGNIRLLLPLISDINELYTSKEIINEVREELGADPLPIGCMIEVPSAVMICDALARDCDFLSLGTNDLVQYTLGVDRGNPSMRDLYYPAHPSVLRMIKMITLEAKRKETPLSLCGEIASSTLFTPLLLGLGLREFSVAPRYLPLIKQTIRKWSILEAYELAEKALKLTDPKEISKLLTAAVKS